jgi:hypothetical protein
MAGGEGCCGELTPGGALPGVCANAGSCTTPLPATLNEMVRAAVHTKCARVAGEAFAGDIIGTSGWAYG